MIIYSLNDEESSKEKTYWINKAMTIKAKTYLLKCTRLEKVLCLVSDLFAISENIRVSQIKVSETGKQ